MTEPGPEWDSLVDAAWAARENAYAPYSNFRVGAAILIKGGAVAVGCNIENASYPLCLCAERAALANAVAQHGAKPGDIWAIAVVAEAPNRVPPCGACRQALSEFGTDVHVLLSNQRGGFAHWTLRELLPNAFSPRDLATQENDR